jgi:hypothetical protein
VGSGQDRREDEGGTWPRRTRACKAEMALASAACPAGPASLTDAARTHVTRTHAREPAHDAVLRKCEYFFSSAVSPAARDWQTSAPETAPAPAPSAAHGTRAPQAHPHPHLCARMAGRAQ